jgi:hypothetical protein
MDGEGFEPSKAVPTDLQSAPFGHSGIHPYAARSNLVLTGIYYIISTFLLQGIFLLFYF